MNMSLDVTNSRPIPLLHTGGYDFVHFCQLAALVVTLYDHLLTFDVEVEYIWKRRWSNFKVLFILARYFGDLLLISICVVFLNRNAGFLFCNVGIKLVGTGSMIVILLTQVIMMLRIKAMYGQIMSRLITIMWILEVIATVALGVASLVAIGVAPYTLENIRMCNPTYLPPFAFLFWVPVIVFETFLFLLAFRMAYHNYLEIGSWRGLSIFHVVLRDNFIFFVCAFALYVVTAVTWLTADPRYLTVPGAFASSLTAIMGCRLILNLCQVYHGPNDMAIRPQSIWAASDGVRFKPPGSSTITGSVPTTAAGQSWTMRRESSALSSLMPTGNPTGSAYEMRDLAPLDGAKGVGSNDQVTISGESATGY